jgi:hypothetical protein
MVGMESPVILHENKGASNELFGETALRSIYFELSYVQKQ